MRPRTHVCALMLTAIASASALAAPQERTLKYKARKAASPVRVGPSEPADPPPVYAKGRHRIGVKWDKQSPSITLVETIPSPKAESVERWAGRFALELFEHGVLLERVRFNFPMLGATPREGEKSMASSIDENMSATTEVTFPATDRGDTLELRDRATGRRWQLAWPPKVAPLKAVEVHDAGAPSADASVK